MNELKDDPPSPQPSGTASHWLDGLRAGSSLAAQELWNRYFARLVAVAEARLSRLTAESSGEDIALSALKSVMIGIQADRFPELTDRDSLWPLLVTITARKAISEQRRQLAGRRSRNLECSFDDLRDFIGVEPSPTFAIEVADELERLLKSLDDATLRTIVERRIAGCSNEEIAEELNCSVRTIARKLDRIRREWQESSLAADDACEADDE